MRVVHVNCVRDAERRTSEGLLDEWPTLFDVAHAVKCAGTDVAIVQSSHANAALERDGIPVRFVAEPGGIRGHAPLRLARAVRAFRPDVIHVNGFGFPFHTRALCALGQPVLVQHHADSPDTRMHRIRRWGLTKVAGAAFAAPEQAEPFFRNRSLRPATPIFAVLESSTHFHAGDRTVARRATGIHGEPAILWVGHLDENKDPVTILEGFARALPRIPQAQLWYCYRKAPLLESLRARLAAEPALSEHVHFLGNVPHAQVEMLCRAADIFTLASRREGCSYALLEALACGATPAVSDIPAFRAMTGNGAVGSLCTPGDAGNFARAFVAEARLADDDLRARVAGHFESSLSFPVLGRKLAFAYETLLEISSRGGAAS